MTSPRCDSDSNTLDVRARSRGPALASTLACTALLALGAPIQDADAQSERRTLSGSTVSIYNVVGRVRVEAGSGSDVVVEITRGGRDASRLRINSSEQRGRNTLSIVYPDDEVVYNDRYNDARDRIPGWGGRSSAEFRVNDDGTWGDNWRGSDGRRIRVRNSGNGLEAWADMRILVPSGKKIDVNVGVGQLDVDRVNADLMLDVAAAHVTVTGTRGRLSVDAGSGGVELRDVTADELNIDTGSGGVRFSGVSGGRCSIDTGSGGVTGDRVTCDDISVDAGSGSIRVDDLRAPNAAIESGSGGVRLGLRIAPRTLRVESGSGGVTVSMPDNAGADVEVQTGSGSITSDFAVSTTRIGRNHLHGRIGNGAGRIYIESGSGSVRLLRGS